MKKCVSQLAIICLVCLRFIAQGKAQTTHPSGSEDRAFWVKTMVRIADPVLTNLSNQTLKKNMLTNRKPPIDRLFPIWKPSDD